MGKLGIPVWCYEWMGGVQLDAHLHGNILSRRRTRNGATINKQMRERAETPNSVLWTEEQLWDNLEYFLQRVVPGR